MTIKITKTQLHGLHDLLTSALITCMSGSIDHKLYAEIVDALNERIRKKTRSGLKDKITLKMSSIESKALFCWFQTHVENLRVSYPYEVGVLQTICMQVHKENA